MLTLTRPVREIVMSDDVAITTPGVKGNQVGVGINAQENNIAEYYEAICVRIKREWQQLEPPSTA